MTLLPPRLQYGDTIGIVAPSDPVTDINRDFGAGIDQFEAGIHFLEQQGFSVQLAPNVFAVGNGYSASPQEKIEDIHTMFADPNIKAIICAQGGNNANTLLPYLNYEIIAANPKIFLGISDITALLNAIFAKTGLVTFHGNDVMRGFGRPYTAYDEESFRDRLMKPEIGSVAQNSQRRILQGGRAEGTLLGGNIDVFLKLMHGPYQPVLDGAILFLEDFGEVSRPSEFESALAQLQQYGVFDQIGGLLLGYYKSPSEIDVATIAKQVLGDRYDMPIVQCDDFGHNCPNTVLPVGTRVCLDGEKAQLEIFDACVK